MVPLGPPTTTSPVSTPTTATRSTASTATVTTPTAFMTTSRVRPTGARSSPRSVPCEASPASASADAVATVSGSSSVRASPIAAIGRTRPLPATAATSPGPSRSPSPGPPVRAMPTPIATGTRARSTEQHERARAAQDPADLGGREPPERGGGARSRAGRHASSSVRRAKSSSRWARRRWTSHTATPGRDQRGHDLRRLERPGRHRDARPRRGTRVAPAARRARIASSTSGVLTTRPPVSASSSVCSSPGHQQRPGLQHRDVAAHRLDLGEQVRRQQHRRPGRRAARRRPAGRRGCPRGRARWSARRARPGGAGRAAPRRARGAASSPGSRRGSACGAASASPTRSSAASTGPRRSPPRRGSAAALRRRLSRPERNGWKPGPSTSAPTSGSAEARSFPAAPEELHRPGGRAGQPEQHPDEGGLARPVGAEHPEHGAGRDVEVDVVDRHRVPEGLAQPADPRGDRVRGGRGRRLRGRRRSPPSPGQGLGEHLLRHRTGRDPAVVGDDHGGDGGGDHAPGCPTGRSPACRVRTGPAHPRGVPRAAGRPAAGRAAGPADPAARGPTITVSQPSPTRWPCRSPSGRSRTALAGRRVLDGRAGRRGEGEQRRVLRPVGDLGEADLQRRLARALREHRELQRLAGLGVDGHAHLAQQRALGGQRGQHQLVGGASGDLGGAVDGDGARLPQRRDGLRWRRWSGPGCRDARRPPGRPSPARGAGRGAVARVVRPARRAVRDQRPLAVGRRAARRVRVPRRRTRRAPRRCRSPAAGRRGRRAARGRCRPRPRRRTAAGSAVITEDTRSSGLTGGSTGAADAPAGATTRPTPTAPTSTAPNPAPTQRLRPMTPSCPRAC